MFLLYFLYGLILGIFLYMIFKSHIETLLFYIIIFEMCIFIGHHKFKIKYDPLVRFSYITSLLIGYFSGFILYDGLDPSDPNIPDMFY